MASAVSPTEGGERVVLERRGKEVAVLVSVEDAQLLEALEDKVDLGQARAALRDAKRNGTVAWEKVKEDLGL